MVIYPIFLVPNNSISQQNGIAGLGRIMLSSSDPHQNAFFWHIFWPPAAFSNVLLLDDRWLLGGQPRDAGARTCHIWCQVLTVDFLKQELFVKRILFLHDVACRRAGKACSVRLPLTEWLTECDRMCFVSQVLALMAYLVDRAWLQHLQVVTTSL